MSSDRDRLILDITKSDKATNEKCKNCTDPKGSSTYCAKCACEQLADNLLADGWIRPPCKVGDTVYYFSHLPFNLSLLPNTIYEADVVRIVTTKLGTSVIIQIHNDYGCTEVPQISDFGKTVFLTKEEAESELRKRSDDNA